MRKVAALVAGLLVLVLVNALIFEREQLLARGRVVLLELAPVDPRSLMQGDYMLLSFQVENDALAQSRVMEELKDGCLVLRVNPVGVGVFSRFDRGGFLEPEEIRLRYRVRNGRMKFATNAFFFQEGKGPQYENARYGVFRVDDNGDALLTGLLSGDMLPLGETGQSRP